jgi:hypothetical protein
MQEEKRRTESPFADILREFFVTYSTEERTWTPRLFAERYPKGSNGKGIDVSQVHLWLNGKRVPVKTPYHLARIVQTFGLSDRDTLRLMTAFQQSQLLRADDTANKRRIRSSTHLAVQTIGRRAVLGQRVFRSDTLPQDLERFPLPQGAIVLRDVEQLARTAIRMMIAAPPLSQPHSRTMYLTSNGAADFALPAELFEWWQVAVRGALQRGWDLRHFIRLDENLERSIALVESIRAYLGAGGTGTYYPHYFTQSGTRAVPEDWCVVPGVGALQLFAINQQARVDSAIYMCDPAQVALLVDHMERFRRPRGIIEELLTAYPSADEMDVAFFQALSDYEMYPGPIFVATEDFPESARPPSFFREGSTWRTHWGPLEAIIRQRVDTLQWHARLYPHRFLTTMQALRDFVVYGSHNDSRWLSHRREDSPYRPEERFAQIEHLARLLTFDKYEIAIIDDSEPEPVQLLTSFWETIGDSVVVLISWQPNERNEEEQVRLQIREPTIVHAFRKYGEDVWNRVPGRYREKLQVIDFLKQQLKELEERYPDEIKAFRQSE